MSACRYSSKNQSGRRRDPRLGYGTTELPKRLQVRLDGVLHFVSCLFDGFAPGGAAKLWHARDVAFILLAVRDLQPVLVVRRFQYAGRSTRKQFRELIFTGPVSDLGEILNEPEVLRSPHV